MRRGLVAIALLAALVGCSDADDAAKTSDGTSPPTSFCEQLFAGSATGPIEVIGEWWTTDDVGMNPELSQAVAEVERIAAAAGSDLRPYLLTVVSQTRNAAEDGGDPAAFKAAGLAVGDVCFED